MANGGPVSRGDELEQLRGRILALHPELADVTLQVLARGQTNLVLRAGGLVFRFSRYGQPDAVFEREAAILRRLAPRLPLPIPLPVDVLPDLFSYRLLAGAPLDRRRLAEAAPAVLDELARQLGSFLRALHDAPIPPELAPASPEFQLVQPWKDLHRRADTGVRQLLTAGAWRRLDAHFQAFFARYQRREISPVVIHGDFGAGNILWDESVRRVTAVIDFSSATLGDPAVDLAAASTIAPGFLHRLAAAYPLAGDLADRARFYRGTFALQEAVFGVENRDEPALEAGLRSLESMADSPVL